MIILFLDFDGVLHGYAPWPHSDEVRSQYFAFLPRLESVLRHFPDAYIVVASDWRLHHTLDELRAYFSEDIRLRVIGTTALERPTGYAVGQRQLQAEEYLRAHNLVGTPWIAVDDMQTNYQADACLILCKDGFGEAEEAALRKLLVSI